MKQVKLTDPFTGIGFDAIQDSAGNIVTSMPLCHMEIKARYDAKRHSYEIPAIWFEHRPTCTFTETADLLHVSAQRVTALVKSGMLQAHTLPNGSRVILLDDITDYNKNRKNGRPRKEQQEC